MNLKLINEKNLKNYFLNHKINLMDLSKYNSIFVFEDRLYNFLIKHQDIILSFNSKGDAFKYCAYVSKDVKSDYLVKTLIHNGIKDKDEFLKVYSYVKGITTILFYSFINKIKEYYKINTNSNNFLNIRKEVGNYFIFRDKGIKYIDVKTSLDFLILIYQMTLGEVIKTKFNFLLFLSESVYNSINNIKLTDFKERLNDIIIFVDKRISLDKDYFDRLYKNYSKEKAKLIIINIMVNNEKYLLDNYDKLTTMYRKFING